MPPSNAIRSTLYDGTRSIRRTNERAPIRDRRAQRILMRPPCCHNEPRANQLCAEASTCTCTCADARDGGGEPSGARERNKLRASRPPSGRRDEICIVNNELHIVESSVLRERDRCARRTDEVSPSNAPFRPHRQPARRRSASPFGLLSLPLSRCINHLGCIKAIIAIVRTNGRLSAPAN